MTLAYAQALQYWAEKTNLPAPGEPCSLAMSIHELRQHMGKHITFHNCNIFKGLADTLPRAMVEDTQPSHMGNSPADDLTISSSTSEAVVEVDAQPGPVGMPLADDPTILLVIPEAEIGEDLSATQSTSPAKLGKDSIALTTAWADQLANHPTSASSMGN